MVQKISDKNSDDFVPSEGWNWLVDLTDGTGVSDANLKWSAVSGADLVVDTDTFVVSGGNVGIHVADPSYALEVDGDISLTGSLIGYTIPEKFSYETGHAAWADGLSSEEIHRIQLQSGETLTVDRIEFRQKGGGSSSSASIDVYDSTGATIIGSANLGSTVKNPGSSGSGNLVLIRLNNSTGGSINASVRVVGYIEGA